MKKFIFIAAFFLVPTCVFGGQYAGFQAGTDYRIQTDASNSGQKVGYKAGVLYGYDFGNNVRTEAEISYREAHKRTQYVESHEDQISFKRFDSHHAWSYMANLCYDLSSLSAYSLTPYLGLGVGYSQNVEHRKIQASKWSNTEKLRDSNFAYQALVGLSYDVTTALKARAQYCYHIAGPHSKNHAVTAALVKAF